MDQIYYKPPIYRPPSEAQSLLIQATEGCTYKCTFCVSNLSKKFKIRSIEDIKKDLESAKNIYQDQVKRLFLLDGNAMVIPFPQLIEIVQYASSLFPGLRRISTYSHAHNILRKSDDELKQLFDSGLKMLYIGIETGHDPLLKKIHKRVRSEQIVEAFHKCFKAGITPSGMFILGLAGNNPQLSKNHIIDTAKLINAASPKHIFPNNSSLPPWYISCLALMLPPGTPMHEEHLNGELQTMSPIEILQEMELFMEHITDDTQNCIFRSNHASNYLPIKGNLNKDRDRLLNEIRYGLQHNSEIRPEFYRAL